MEGRRLHSAPVIHISRGNAHIRMDLQIRIQVLHIKSLAQAGDKYNRIFKALALMYAVNAHHLILFGNRTQLPEILAVFLKIFNIAYEVEEADIAGFPVLRRLIRQHPQIQCPLGASRQRRRIIQKSALCQDQVDQLMKRCIRHPRTHRIIKCKEILQSLPERRVYSPPVSFRIPGIRAGSATLGIAPMGTGCISLGNCTGSSGIPCIRAGSITLGIARTGAGCFIEGNIFATRASRQRLCQIRRADFRKILRFQRDKCTRQHRRKRYVLLRIVNNRQKMENRHHLRRSKITALCRRIHRDPHALEHFGVCIRPTFHRPEQNHDVTVAQLSHAAFGAVPYFSICHQFTDTHSDGAGLKLPRPSRR